MSLHKRTAVSSILLLGMSMAHGQRPLDYDDVVVPQNRIDARDLGYAPLDVIPNGESAITSLTVAPHGKLYGATSGKRSHLFVLNPRHGYVQPLGAIPDTTEVTNALVVSEAGDVYIGTSPLGHLLKYSPAGEDVRSIRIGEALAVSDLGMAVSGERIAALVIDRAGGFIYGLTSSHAHFFSYCLATGKFKDHGVVANNVPEGEKFETQLVFSRMLAVDRRGTVYASGEDGYLYRFSLASQRLEKLALQLPAIPGREPWTRADTFLADPSGVIYGGTSDGYLFRFDPEKLTLQNLGKPLIDYRITGLAHGPNGKIYGVGGDESDIARLFSYDPCSGAYELLGFVDVNRRPYYTWQAYVVKAMATGLDGTIYIGESERISRLYFFILGDPSFPGDNMNRRDFMGTIVAGAAVEVASGRAVTPSSQRNGRGSRDTPATGEGPTSLPRAQWLKNGLIDAGGTHEPYTFVVRRGGARLDARQQYEQQQSEALIRRLKEQGVEVFHTHLYKGFGMAAEKLEMEDTRRAAAIAHGFGMKVDTYIQWNTMMYETFFAEEPRARDWIQRDVNGQPILLPYGFQQAYRYRPCFSHHEYRDYLKKVVRYAVEEVHTDFIHFDNFDLNAEPDSCHCPACVEGFRSFLKAKYPLERRRERFGFENVDYVNPPKWNRENSPEKMQIIFDPVIQEWVDFRCQLMADALRELALYAKSLTTEVVIEINPHGITGANRAWEAAIDHARLLKWTEAFWTEEENRPRVEADGRLISKIRSYKLARTYDNILLTYITSDPVAMAESLAFNQTLGYIGEDPLSHDTRHYLDFYRNHRELYVGSREAANVAVLRSYPSITYHNARAQLSAVLVEQALIQAQVPFVLIFDEHLKDLAKYRAVVLPNSECLSDEQLRLLRHFVEQGGGLVVTEQAGLYDEWRRLRVEPGLRDLVGPQLPGAAYEERAMSSLPPGGSSARKEVGKGRVVYFPVVEFDGALPEPEPYFVISNRFWKRPKNWAEIVEGVRWAAREEIPLRVTGPEYLVANLVEQPGRRILHLVNYHARKVPEIPAVKVWCGMPQGATPRKATLYSPDERVARALEFQAHSGGVSFEVPKVATYAVVAVG